MQTANLIISLLKGVDPKDGIPYEKKFCEGMNGKNQCIYPNRIFFSSLSQTKSSRQMRKCLMLQHNVDQFTFVFMTN